MTVSAISERRILLAQVLGVTLCGCGTVADVAVGLAILRGASPWLLLLHLPAVGIWIEGLCTIDGRSAWEEGHAIFVAIRRWRRAAVHGESVLVAAGERGWNARTAAMAVLSLALFPGFGPIGCTVAFSLAALPFMIRRRRPAPPIDVAIDDGAVPPAAPINPLLDLAVQPLVDIVNGSDRGQKRAAIRMLGEQFDHEAVHLLRSLLTDPDPDVRSEASVTLFRFEDLVTRAVNEAATSVQDDPTAVRYVALGAAYRRAVNLGLLDGTSARHYFSQALAAYEHAATLEPGQASHRIALAELHRDLGDGDAALLALEAVLSIDAGNVSANLLRMEIAFAERRWDIVAAASPVFGDAADSPAAAPLFRWWSGATIGEEGPALNSAHVREAGGDL